MKKGKRLKNLAKKVEVDKLYEIPEAVKLLKELKSCKYDETIEIAMKLGVDPKQADQNIRGTVSLPAGSGKKVRILAFAKGEKEAEAREAGADFIADDETVKKVQGGWFGFDLAIATPDMMGTVGRLGKLLGPKGLMPNPKSGTVTMDIGKAITEFKAGRIEYRVNKFADMNVRLGKISFSEENIIANLTVFLQTVLRVRPASLKGTYIEGITLSLTQSPGVKLDVSKARAFVSTKA